MALLKIAAGAAAARRQRSRCALQARIRPQPAPGRWLRLCALLLPVAACGPDAGPPAQAGAGTDQPGATDAQTAAAEDRFRPGLHRLMVDMQFRHANVWFAGQAENWPLADYHMHEIEELVAEILELHPTYDDLPIGELMNALLLPAVQQLAAAVDDGDGPAFEMAFDRFTEQCNACHEATMRGMIAVQRPRTPPLDNVRFSPDR